ncbi:MAG TPA: radical SAM protein [Candidatus Avalokitesvara rifleensis]|uniref:radical SAM protein n=1 Tax=Candidatus Avalokitesvara rifleensis TaxID=3367620 RepID=UPI002714073B|nr:radical SAM protein [Candidatus Brocadiales bacterium]
MNKLIKHAAFAKEILKGHILQKNIPVLVTLCVTNRCNLKCIYCYEECFKRPERDFTTEEVLSLVDELSEMGTKYISINGGEALLRDDIETIIDRINEKNILCHLSTNGILIPKKINAVRKMDSLSISIDGARGSNDLNRGTGTYDKIIEAFKSLKANHVNFQTSTVVTKNNENAVDEIMDLALNYGFSAQFSLLRRQDSPNKDIGLEDDQIKALVQRIMDYKEKGFPVFFSCDSYENVLNWPFSYDKQIIFNEPLNGYKPIKCYIKKFACHIEANGLVYPCVVLVNKFRALNFLEVGFKKAWQNLEKNNCKACYCICHSELNQIFGLRPKAIWNLKDYVKKYSVRRMPQ